MQRTNRKSNIIFFNTLFREPFTHPHELLREEMSLKKQYKQFRFIKRLSPFLLTVLFLPALFTYLFFEGKWVADNVWVLCFSFVFVEINFLFIDFALWKYYKGKKIFRIWLLEAPLVFVAVYFFI